jgi:2,4-dienoyl-CoA reductase-like NADH-dependent reductase (Old Yellow Enzyme family)
MAAARVGTPVTFSRSGRTAPNVFLKVRPPHLREGGVLLTRCDQSAMTERLCTWSDENPDECGKPTPEYVRLYEEWGKGEIGVIVLGNIPCDRRYPEAKGTCYELRNTVDEATDTVFAGNAVMDPLSPWDAVAAFKPVIAGAKAKGSLVIGQVTHAGRVRLVYLLCLGDSRDSVRLQQTPSEVTKEPVSSSDVPSGGLGGMTFHKPRPLTVDEIKDVVQRFAFAAKTLYDVRALPYG